MKLSAAFGLISDLRAAIGIATLPTLKAIYREPSLVLRPTSVSRIFMAAVWSAFAGPTDEGARAPKLTLIPHATGAVLDIGAGLGHSIDYLDRTVVTAYIALEPNELMHAAIRARAKAAGFREEDVLILRGCGAEDPTAIRAQLDGAGLQVDTMLSVMTFCSIPDPEQTLTQLVRQVLAPGGRLLFYEHVLSPRADVAWWQRFWTPLWRLAFDGCCLDRPTHLWVAAMEDEGPDGQSMNMWSQHEVWGKEGEPEEHLFWHRVGKFIKHND
ncbi:S-adenosyl-L-methionine-dependent methyltransferase [Mycena albidolilacea]|uniref:S-adenosyl-L-methionine-dependent methyltransferase n=1 Tax=Mycena albidolilacea TaxID=1033008 RepID=A0AAD7EWQ3_9AGAR|nr:S-adenosyl-L-methionine-dependent methyltransferase [Mycena albidolilacea]